MLRFWPYRCDDCSTRFWRFARNPVMAQRAVTGASGPVMLPERTAPASPRSELAARPRRSRVPTPPSGAMA